MLATRDIELLASVARYYTLTRKQINLLHFPSDIDGRVTRRRLRILHESKLINRTNMQVSNPTVGAPAFVYYPSADGCAYLAQELNDETYKRACTTTPNWTYLYHWVEVAETHIRLDRAVQKFPGVSISNWIGEYSIADSREQEPEKRYKLYTRLGPKLVCAPDAAFQLTKNGFCKGHYLEEDRDTTKSADRVAAQKCHGFASMFEQRKHLERHFPTANVEKFTVLFVTPSERRRDALRKAFASKPAEWMYRFAAKPDLNPDSFLRAPVWYPCEGDPVQLVSGTPAEDPVPLLEEGDR